MSQGLRILCSFISRIGSGVWMLFAIQAITSDPRRDTDSIVCALMAILAMLMAIECKMPNNFKE